MEQIKRYLLNSCKPTLIPTNSTPLLSSQLPAYIWSEDYQSQVFSRHFRAFDDLRRQQFFIGEFVWNFADFKTAQSKPRLRHSQQEDNPILLRLTAYTRVGGNKKGIFTRNRQPKAAAYLLRQRYHALAQELDKSTLPGDLFLYTAPDGTEVGKSEL